VKLSLSVSPAPRTSVKVWVLVSVSVGGTQGADGGVGEPLFSAMLLLLSAMSVGARFGWAFNV